MARRRILLAVAMVVAGLALVAGWLAYTGLAARDRLQSARSEVDLLREQVLHRQGGDASRTLARVRADAAAARELTDSPLWRAMGHVPYLGRSVQTTAGVAATVEHVADDVLRPLVLAGGLLDPQQVRVAPGQVDLARIAWAAHPLEEAVTALTQARRRLADLPTRVVLPPVEDARTELSGALDALSTELGRAATATRLLPSMLGADGPRRYFVAFQTNAEARGTGGLVGAFGIVQADHGLVQVQRLDSNLALQSGARPAVDLGADFTALYGDDPGLWQNSNESANFPYAARLWLAMWLRQTGQHLDGAIATDPTALGYLLAATGPVTLRDGEQVTADNVVALTERDVYARFAGDDAARKQFLVSIARAVTDRLLTRVGDPRALANAVSRALDEHRLLVYSAHPAAQRLLTSSGVAGQVPDAPGPYAALVVNNGAGNKLDFYLQRWLSYVAGVCRRSTRASTVTVTLRNDAPASGLPRYVTARLDARRPTVPGSNRLLVYVYLAQGARLQAATLDGGPVGVVVGRERGHPVAEVSVDLDPGRARTLVLRLVEPTARGPARVPVQPLAQPQRTSVDVPACR